MAEQILKVSKIGGPSMPYEEIWALFSRNQGRNFGSYSAVVGII